MANAETENNLNFYPLVFFICGYEKSGTTLLNEVFRNHPRLNSGHEVGAFLKNSPRDFSALHPYFAFFKNSWKLTNSDVDFICDTDNWSEFYKRARDRSPLIKQKNVELFDKTPIYMKFLDEVLFRAPGIPCIVNVRDPRAVMVSWANWSGFKDDPEKWLVENLDSNCERYCLYGQGYKRSMTDFSERIIVNQFETLCENPVQSFYRLFEFVGYEFSNEFLDFNSEHFVYGTTVSDEYIDNYSQVLNSSTCSKILAKTREFSDWHFHP